jgi:O-antigen/teichoic acid export membrane protein
VFLILAMSLPIVFVTGVFRGVLGAAQRFDLVNAVSIPSSSLSYLIPAAAVLLGFGLPAIVLFFLIARLATALAYLVLCLRIFPGLKHTFSFDRRLLRPLLSYGGWVTVSSVVGPVLIYLDRFLIGALISMAAVAYYAAPFEVVARLAIFPGSLVRVLFPAFSSLAASREQAKTKRIFARSLRYLLLFMGPFVLLLIFFAQDIIRLWLGADFAERSTAVFQILAIGVLVNSLAWLPNTLLQSVGRPDITAKCLLLEVPVYVGLAWFLTVNYGLVGAALAWTLRGGLDAALLFGACSVLKLVPLCGLVENGLWRGLAVFAAFAAALSGVALVSAGLLTELVSAGVIAALLAVAVWTYGLDGTDRDFLGGTMARVLTSTSGS